MNINLFNTNKEELNGKLAGTKWQVAGITLEVKRVYLDEWRGQHCAEFTDNSWSPVENLLKKAEQIS